MGKKRDWKEYDEELIKRGEFYFKPVFLESWNSEIKEMNAAKVGEPYLYPESLIKFLAVLCAKHFTPRECVGILRELSEYFGIPFPIISYSQINRRVNALELDFGNAGNDVEVAIDGTGMKLTNRGEYIRHKWKVMRGWVKVVIMGWMDKEIEKRRFASRTHALEFAIAHLKEEIEKGQA